MYYKVVPVLFLYYCHHQKAILCQPVLDGSKGGRPNISLPVST